MTKRSMLKRSVQLHLAGLRLRLIWQVPLVHQLDKLSTLHMARLPNGLW